MVTPMRLLSPSTLLFFLLLLLLAPLSTAWWLLSDLYSVPLSFPRSFCSRVPGLSRRQRELCVRHPSSMRSLVTGLRLAHEECERQFAGQVWNCSSSADGRPFGSTPLIVASKESAFVYAVSSAGVSHSLARACARGEVDDCGCGPTPRGAPNVVSRERVHGMPQKFMWAGCSDNLRYGNSFGRRFVDVNDKHGDARALMNLHNNRVGRRLLAASMRKECKCHGVSGSCVTRTCWKVVPNFSSFAAQLKEKYEHAQQVTVAPHSTDLILRGVSESGRAGRYLKEYSKKAPKADLVYLDASPDYCGLDPKASQGRECGSNCERICCGRGWDTLREVVEEPCQCRFIWCCEVKCQTCEKVVDKNFCR